MTRTDEELVARATAGDLDSFNQLVSRWERPIYALAYRTLGREEDARDVVQEAFLRAYRGLRGFKGEAKFSSWLYRITLNLCRDWIRRERRAPVVQVARGHRRRWTWPTRRPRRPNRSRIWWRGARCREAVARAMAELPEEQRTAIMLKEYHGLTFQEIADQLDCPLSTVKTRLYQGLSVLRRRLERRQAEEASLRRATWEGTELRGPIVMCENRERLIGYVYDECDPAERRRDRGAPRVVPYVPPRNSWPARRAPGSAGVGRARERSDLAADRRRRARSRRGERCRRGRWRPRHAPPSWSAPLAVPRRMR